jgi:hypothetical protein
MVEKRIEEPPTRERQENMLCYFRHMPDNYTRKIQVEKPASNGVYVVGSTNTSANHAASLTRTYQPLTMFACDLQYTITNEVPCDMSTEKKRTP